MYVKFTHNFFKWSKPRNTPQENGVYAPKAWTRTFTAALFTVPRRKQLRWLINSRLGFKIVVYSNTIQRWGWMNYNHAAVWMSLKHNLECKEAKRKKIQTMGVTSYEVQKQAKRIAVLLRRAIGTPRGGVSDWEEAGRWLLGCRWCFLRGLWWRGSVQFAKI